MKTSKRVRRRRFLTAAAAVSLPSPFLRVPGAMASGSSEPPRRRIAIGFLGASHSHARGKLQVILNSPDYELVGVCDESEAVRRECAKLRAEIVSRDDLLGRCEVIAVESAVRDHSSDGLWALRAGKHVHLEKPPATSLGDVQEMVRLAREKKLVLQLGYMWRHHPGFQAIFEAARRGWLGSIFMVRGTMTNHLAPAQRQSWAGFKGGSLYELGSHLVDAVVRLMGKPRAVTPFLRRHGDVKDDLKDNNLVVIEFERALAVIANTSLQPTEIPYRSFEVLGSKGSAVLRPLEPPALEMELLEDSGPYKKGIQTVKLPPYRRYEGDFVELAAAVRGDRSLSVSLEEEIVVQETLLRASEML